jgi:hypothetical protein
MTSAHLTSARASPRAPALACTLTPSPGDSSSDLLALHVMDLDEVPEAVARTTKQLAGNAAHLARVLRHSPYPA